jgi:hypothetical protein
MTLPPHLWNLATLPWISARVAYGTAMRGENRKDFAAALHTACCDLLTSASTPESFSDEPQFVLHEDQLAITARG